MQQLGLMYLDRKAVVLASPFGADLLHETKARFDEVTEQHILSEGAWVILSVGLSSAAVTAVHQRLSPAFYDWRSAAEIVAAREICRWAALMQFGHVGKIDAIIQFAARLERVGRHRFLDELRGGVATTGLPFFGPASSEHLRLNLGVSTVKPDRHLSRLASKHSCDVVTMCERIAAYTGDELRLIDRILWSYASLLSRPAR